MSFLKEANENIITKIKDTNLSVLLHNFNSELESNMDSIEENRNRIKKSEDRTDEEIRELRFEVKTRLDRISRILIASQSLESIEKALVKSLGE